MQYFVFFSLIFTFSPLMSAPDGLCNRQKLNQDLTNYTHELHTFLQSFPQALQSFSARVASQYKIFDRQVINKSAMTEESLEPLYSMEESLNVDGDELYERQLSLLDAFGESFENENLNRHLRLCFGREPLILSSLIESHLTDLSDEQSIASSFGNTLYKYSDLLVQMTEDLTEKISETPLGFVPTRSSFQVLAQLQTASSKAPDCAYPLINLSFARWCQILSFSKLESPLCSGNIYPQQRECL